MRINSRPFDYFTFCLIVSRSPVLGLQHFPAPVRLLYMVVELVPISESVGQKRQSQ